MESARTLTRHASFEVARHGFRPEGAATNQPGATPGRAGAGITPALKGRHRVLPASRHGRPPEGSGRGLKAESRVVLRPFRAVPLRIGWVPGALPRAGLLRPCGAGTKVVSDPVMMLKSRFLFRYFSRALSSRRHAEVLAIYAQGQGPGTKLRPRAVPVHPADGQAVPNRAEQHDAADEEAPIRSHGGVGDRHGREGQAEPGGRPSR